MKLAPGLLVVVTLGVGLNLVFVGCGSEESNDIPNKGDGGPDGKASSSSGGLIDSGPLVTTQCRAKGATCASSAECCTANCVEASPGTNACQDPIGVCKVPGTACTAGNECCTGTCTAGSCQ